MSTNKTYSRNVFSHKKGISGGIDQGKGRLFRDNSVFMAMNIRPENDRLMSRNGQVLYASDHQGVLSAERTTGFMTVSAGTRVYVGETVHDFAPIRGALEDFLGLTVSVSGVFQESNVFSISTSVSGEYKEIEDVIGITTTISGELT